MTGPSTVAAARLELRTALADLRSSLAQVRAGPSRQAREEFERQALGGAFGADARVLAHRLRAGLATWEGVLTGTTPDAQLLCEHLHRMADTHGAAVRAALASELPDRDGLEQ
jgi:hypothetical protein